MIDIANDLIQSGDYKPHEDPTKFKSQKTGRGPLVGKWQDTVSVVESKFIIIRIKISLKPIKSEMSFHAQGWSGYDLL